MRYLLTLILLLGLSSFAQAQAPQRPGDYTADPAMQVAEYDWNHTRIEKVDMFAGWSVAEQLDWIDVSYKTYQMVSMFVVVWGPNGPVIIEEIDKVEQPWGSRDLDVTGQGGAGGIENHLSQQITNPAASITMRIEYKFNGWVNNGGWYAVYCEWDLDMNSSGIGAPDRIILDHD